MYTCAGRCKHDYVITLAFAIRQILSISHLVNIRSSSCKLGVVHIHLSETQVHLDFAIRKHSDGLKYQSARFHFKSFATSGCSQYSGIQFFNFVASGVPKTSESCGEINRHMHTACRRARVRSTTQKLPLKEAFLRNV